MTIKLLPEYLINQIAAGEVVERPLSIVKELLENSIDAKAKHISVICRGSGKSFLQVIDDGIGMTKEDIALCIKRHATSKLPDNSLNNINTMGFRGEALAAISNVARVTIASKTANDEHGWILSINGGEQGEIEPINITGGTIITIKDLFYCVPARLKFLKTNAVEIKQIMDVVNRLAVAHPSIHFSLENNNKVIYDYSVESFSLAEIRKDLAQGEESETDRLLLGRLKQVLGDTFVNNCAKVAHGCEDFKVTGYISLPTFNRPTSAWQFFYIKNRYVKDRFLNYAIKAAYHDYIPHDRSALVVLFLDCNHMSFDINIQPDKTKVRFVDEKFVKSNIIRALKDVLVKVGNKVSDNLNHQLMNKVIAQNKNVFAQSEITNEIESAKVDTSVDAQMKDSVFEKSFAVNTSGANFSDLSLAKKPEQTKAILFNDKTVAIKENANVVNMVDMFNSTNQAESNNRKNSTADSQTMFVEHSLGQALVQVHKTYVISETNEGIVIVDQHAVHERLVYEKLKNDYANGKILTQRLAIPVSVKLSQTEVLLLQECNEDLKNMGLWLEDIKGDGCIVRGLPSYLVDCNAEELVHDICAQIQEFGGTMVLEEKSNELLGNFACHHSIRAGKVMNYAEMDALLRQIEESEVAGQCNHGRPTYVTISKKDLDKMFHRC